MLKSSAAALVTLPILGVSTIGTSAIPGQTVKAHKAEIQKEVYIYQVGNEVIYNTYLLKENSYYEVKGIADIRIRKGRIIGIGLSETVKTHRCSDTYIMVWDYIDSDWKNRPIYTILGEGYWADEEYATDKPFFVPEHDLIKENNSGDIRSEKTALSDKSVDGRFTDDVPVKMWYDVNCQ